jgi:DNA-nicking Smr family endonuclease
LAAVLLAVNEKRHTEAMPREMIRGRRPLTEDEERLWAAVARSVRPLRSKPAIKPPSAHPAKVVPPKPHSAKPSVAKSNATKPNASKPSVARHVEHAPQPVPHKAKPPSPANALARRERQQLARGRAEIDGRIDLHGMTQAEAHDALLRFLRRAQAEGAKFVLVITGKGGPGGDRGVLRRQVPLWLALPELRASVLGFDAAHVGHGGEGALYVRLRKAR